MNYAGPTSAAPTEALPVHEKQSSLFPPMPRVVGAAHPLTSAAPSISDWFSTYEVHRLAAVTMRQLQWWDERNLVSPMHVGHQRQYSTAEALQVLLIRELRVRGFSLYRIRAVVMQLRKANVAGMQWFLTDGKRIVLVANTEFETLASFIEQRRTPPFVVISLVRLQAKIAEAQEESRRPARIGPSSAGPARHEQSIRLA